MYPCTHRRSQPGKNPLPVRSGEELLSRKTFDTHVNASKCIWTHLGVFEKKWISWPIDSINTPKHIRIRIIYHFTIKIIKWNVDAASLPKRRHIPHMVIIFIKTLTAHTSQKKKYILHIYFNPEKPLALKNLSGPRKEAVLQPCSMRRNSPKSPIGGQHCKQI